MTAAVAHLVDARARRVVRVLEGHEHTVYGVDFHPTGRWLVTASSDETLRLWDMRNGAAVQRVEVGVAVYSVVWDPVGKLVAAATELGTVELLRFVSANAEMRSKTEVRRR